MVPPRQTLAEEVYRALGFHMGLRVPWSHRRLSCTEVNNVLHEYTYNVNEADCVVGFMHLELRLP